MSALIGDGKVAAIHFTLRTDGQQIDSTGEGDPILYLHGAQNIVPGLEAALVGKSAGDDINVTVEPKDGYGERVDAPAMRVPRDQFPPDFPLTAGMPIGGEDGNGNVIPFWITAIEDDAVVVDPNHPLAGRTLEFEVKVLEVRDATPSELEHGHPHGPGGAH